MPAIVNAPASPGYPYVFSSWIDTANAFAFSFVADAVPEHRVYYRTKALAAARRPSPARLLIQKLFGFVCIRTGYKS